MTCLTCVCAVMGLLVLLPTLRVTVLEPAVSVLTEGVQYSARLIAP
jgi:hypothetical protein